VPIHGNDQLEAVVTVPAAVARDLFSMLTYAHALEEKHREFLSISVLFRGEVHHYARGAASAPFADAYEPELREGIAFVLPEGFALPDEILPRAPEKPLAMVMPEGLVVCFHTPAGELSTEIMSWRPVMDALVR